jgi:S-adenosylmethionine:diacylglycerol 3-amino-3-carboxypropyl transferase
MSRSRLAAGGPAMKRLLAWTGSADSDHQRKTWGARGAGPLDPTNRHFWTERALFGRGRLRFRGLIVAPGDAGTRLA